MVAVISEARTHEYEGELVVFLIGMRINRWWRVDQWFPVFQAMPAMLAELSRDPNSGLLGYRLVLAQGGPMVVQYWSSHERLYEYASSPQAAHRPAWTSFNRRARKAPGVVGIWHETFEVERAHSMYVAMPVVGLAKATTSVPVGPRRDRARGRHDAARTAA